MFVGRPYPDVGSQRSFTAENDDEKDPEPIVRNGGCDIGREADRPIGDRAWSRAGDDSKGKSHKNSQKDRGARKNNRRRQTVEHDIEGVGPLPDRFAKVATSDACQVVGVLSAD